MKRFWNLISCQNQEVRLVGPVISPGLTEPCGPPAAGPEAMSTGFVS